MNTSIVGGNSLRNTKSADSLLGSPSFLNNKHLMNSSKKIIDKSSILWKDFINGIKRRKAMLIRLRDSALESTTSQEILKRLLLEFRQTTLTLIEDALEIEYRYLMQDNVTNNGENIIKKSSKMVILPPINSFRSMEDKEDIYALAEIINDVDDLFQVPNVRALLPHDFPHKRNSFLLGKSVDDLSSLVTPHPEAGNIDEELKVLELLRYKRASKALLRAEAQVLNNLPINLYDTERFLTRLSEDHNIEKLCRAVCTLIDNDREDFDMEANVACLVSPVFNCEAHNLLAKLNSFRGSYPMRIDIQVAVRQLLRECNFDYLNDPVSNFLIEWINLVLSNSASINKSNQRNYTAAPTSSFPRYKENITRNTDIEKFKSRQLNHLNVLNQDNLDKLNNTEYNDMTSIISSTNCYQETHENILIDNKPTLKLRYDSSFQDQYRPLSPTDKLIDNNGGNKSRPRTGDQLPPPGSPLFDAIAAGRRAALSSSRPNSRQEQYQTNSNINYMNNQNKVDDDNDENHKNQTRQLSRQNQLTQKDKPRSVQSNRPLIVKSKMTFENPQDADAKLRLQIQRVMKQMGMKSKKNFGGNNEKNELEEEMELDRLSSVRYELHRMQQELLRKQVLDPKHYQINSVDATAQAHSGLTVSEINTRHPNDLIKQKKIAKNINTSKLISLMQRDISTHIDGEIRHIVSLEIEVDPLLEVVIGKIVHRSEIGDDNETRLIEETSFALKSSLQIERKEKKVLKTELYAYTIISKLIYNRLTNFLLSDLLNIKTKDVKGKMLQNIFEELNRKSIENPSLEKGKFFINANRILFSNRLSEDGVLLDLTIIRNDLCDGLIINCQPIAGIYNRGQKNNSSGPITILLYDKELQVLLINQSGMFALATMKWASMEMVAQWLAQRLIIRKVKAFDHIINDDADGDVNSTLSILSNNINSDKVMSNAINSNDNSNNNNTLITTSLNNNNELKNIRSSELVISRPTTQNAKRSRMLVMLDVQLDRKIEISPNLQLQWKSRNMPNIAGMEAYLNAWQDLEMLIININIILPLPHRFNLLKRKENQKSKALKDIEEDLMDLENYSDNDEMDETQLGIVKPVEINLSYRLTSSELSIFGSSELLENKKITLSQTINEKQSSDIQKLEKQHPETFIWNVLNRLRVLFKGSRNSPFHKDLNANDSNNWEIQYVRKLIREVKTVSKAVLILTVSAIGTELIIECEPVDGAIYTKVGSKMLTEEEISDSVYTEGWSLKLLDLNERKRLAMLFLDKLKIVDVETEARLELYSFPETKMLHIAVYEGREPDIELGSVEINYHSTLSDVRILIKHELDLNDVPSQFRFLYKATSCSVKQEPFRRAWDCWPKCFIVSKHIATQDMGMETEDINQKRLKLKQKKDRETIEIPLLPNGQRRVLGRWAPIAVPTLCHVIEGVKEVNLLHLAKDLFQPGDIIRIGNILGRDFIVMKSLDDYNEDNPKTIRIEPEYNLSKETDFSTPMQGNFYFPLKGAGKYYDPVMEYSYEVLKNYKELGFEYQFALPPKLLDDVEVNSADQGTMMITATSDADIMVGTSTQFDPTIGGGKIMMVSNKVGGNHKTKRKLKAMKEGYFDCWIWKCIPSADDTRPKWLQMYENGEVPYTYDFKDSNVFEKHFRIKAYHSYLEVLCTDSRSLQLSLHAQRVYDMQFIPIECYTELIFNKITDWLPVYKKGIERTKFIKIMKEVAAFPDIKKPTRVSQLELCYQKLLKTGEYSIVSKYITYSGFCQLIKEVALIRYPPPRAKISTGIDDNSSIDGGSSITSIESFDSNGSAHTNSKNSPNQSKNKKTSIFSSKRSKHRKKDENKDDGTTESLVDPIYALQSYTKFILEYLMLYPEWYNVIWQQAKILAMKREAIPYCAATRIQAKLRGGVERTKYKFFLRNHIKLQANIRRKLSYKKTMEFIKLLQEDWCLRMRYMYTTIIQSLIRRYLKRCWFIKALDKIKLQQNLVIKAKRFRLKKVRAIARKSIIYKEMKRVNGIIVFIRIMRKDTRSYTRDCSLAIEVYIPKEQSTFKFPLEDVELRFYMQLDLGVDSISIGDLIDPKNLKKLLSTRILVHKTNTKISRIVVSFSKHGLGQRGELSITRGKRIKGEFFICKIFEAGDDLSVQLYHRLTCKIFNCYMPVYEMKEWIKQDTEIKTDDELVRQQELPIFKLENKLQYYEWILDHLAIDTRKGTFKVLFSCHLLKSRKLEMIKKLQSLFRKVLVVPKIIKLLDNLWLKVKTNSWEETFYYLNMKTGETSWLKSKLLGSSDLITKPSRRWVAMNYYDNGIHKVCYVNPWTGKYTNYTIDKAIRKLQITIRNKILLKTIAMPFQNFIKAGKIFKTAKKLYEKSFPKRLAVVINYAMVKHVIELDESSAKSLYAEAVELSEANPLVTRAYAFYMIGTCEAPIKLNRDRSIILLNDAKRKDPENAKFLVAYYLFQFACLRNPYDIRALINLALVQCILYDSNSLVLYNAEKLLRRALAIAPFDSRVLEIWTFLKEKFPERQLIYSSNSRVHKANLQGKTRIIHGRPAYENNLWAGWVYIEKDKMNISKKFKDESYWYNPADGMEQTNIPDFKSQWTIRKNRSHYQEDLYGLEQYYDPLTSEYFQYHPLTDSYH